MPNFGYAESRAGITPPAGVGTYRHGFMVVHKCSVTALLSQRIRPGGDREAYVSHAATTEVRSREKPPDPHWRPVVIRSCPAPLGLSGVNAPLIAAEQGRYLDSAATHSPELLFTSFIDLVIQVTIPDSSSTDL
jgi:hypothetical protein